MDTLVDLGSHCAPQVLQFLRPLEVVRMHLASARLCRFCRAPQSSKLQMPVFTLSKKWESHIELSSVEVLFADDQVLTTMAQQEEFLKTVSQCSALRSLYCANNKNLLGAPLAQALAGLSSLTVLDLAHNHLAVDTRSRFKREQPLQPFFQGLPPRLRILDLSHNLLQDEHGKLLVDALAEHAPNASYLEQLALRSNYLGDKAANALSELMRGVAGAGLQRLDMRTNQVEAGGACALLGALAAHSRMQEIRLGYNRQNSKQDLETCDLACLLLHKAIAANSRALQLQVLDLNNVRVGDIGALRIAQALERNDLLRQLYIAFNSIGSDGAHSLGDALEGNRGLQVLDLRDNEAGDRGAEALARGLYDNFAMRKLLVARNDIGPRGAKALAAAAHQNPFLTVEFGTSGIGGLCFRDTAQKSARWAAYAA